MSSTLYNKKQAIDWIRRNVKENQYIVLTLDMTGSVQSNEKQKCIKTTFAFAADAFVMGIDVRNIAFGKTPALAMVICNSEDLNQKFVNGHDEYLKKKK
jgi:hypothetical protein